MVDNKYKRFVSVVDGKQQLQEVYKRFRFSFKFVDDNRCNMIVIATRRNLQIYDRVYDYYKNK